MDIKLERVRKLSFIPILVLLYSCGTYEKIGNYKYKIKTGSAFTGDYGGIVHQVKTYYLKNKAQAGCVIKSQLGFEPLTDTIYSKGVTEIDNSTKALIIKEYYFYGYSKFLSTDSILKVFKQQPDGGLKLELYKKNGQEVEIPGTK